MKEAPRPWDQQVVGRGAALTGALLNIRAAAVGVHGATKQFLGKYMSEGPHSISHWSAVKTFT